MEKGGFLYNDKEKGALMQNCNFYWCLVQFLSTFHGYILFYKFQHVPFVFAIYELLMRKYLYACFSIWGCITEKGDFMEKIVFH